MAQQGISILHPIYDLVRVYTTLLRERPLLTKAVTSGLISALGNGISQLIKARSEQFKEFRFNAKSLRAFGILGFVGIAPIVHYFFQFLSQVVPPNAENGMVKRVLLERMILAPLNTLVSVVILDICQDQFHWDKTSAKFAPVFLGNLKFWTIPQFINVNFVPIEYRVLFGNVFGVIWNVYLSFAMSKKSLD
ncbi:hypothetical protein TCAL_03191 [Tigriopus californicus]|uniref:Peroxisomal membrane protein 2 n=1 Tax=Tigriopus californicus TaxID=6832 RepID=A0A553N800_TIGCA|nr:peroxisomal membrane protein 2-like [Tigriopus californicus]TRY61548.1 hypothetical protein TCAL_03191 [Tigriopus californicus]